MLNRTRQGQEDGRRDGDSHNWWVASLSGVKNFEELERVTKKLQERVRT